MFSRQPDLGLLWKFKKVKKVNIELFQEYYVKNIPVKLEHNAGKFWGVYWINNEVSVGVGEIDPEGSGSVPETALPSQAVSQITRDQSRLPHKRSW